MKSVHSLRYLKIEIKTSAELLDALVSFDQLEELHLSSQVWSPQKSVELFEPLWSRLRVLSLWLVSDWQDSSEADASSMAKLTEAGPTRLEELNLTMASDKTWDPYYLLQLQLVQKSPKLVRLGLTCQSSRGKVEPSFVDTPRLCQIEYLEFHGDSTRRGNLEAILKGMPRLKGLRLHCFYFDNNSWAKLMDEFPHCLEILTCVDVRGCKVSGKLIMDMLSSLSNLDTFMATYIVDTDIEHTISSSAPWACEHLKTLQMGFIQETGGVLPLFLARVASLTQLETWSLSPEFLPTAPSCIIYRSRWQPYSSCSLKLSLDTDLETLSSLCNLKRFEGPKVSHKMHWREADVQWVLKYWVMEETC